MPDACGELITDEDLSELTGEEQYLAPDQPSLEALPGPLARESVQSAAEHLECLWWVVNVWEGSLPVFVSRIAPEVKTALMDGLQKSTLYTPTEIDGESAFTSSYTDAAGVHQVVYVFVEDVWIAVVADVEPEIAVAIAEKALASITR